MTPLGASRATRAVFVTLVLVLFACNSPGAPGLQQSPVPLISQTTAPPTQPLLPSPELPSATPQSPTSQPVPPSATPSAPTSTPQPPTAIPPDPTSTPQPPTAIPPDPTSTPQPPTATPPDPTSTPQPPTAIPPDPTSTPQPPTATPPDPTSTPQPSTPTPQPPTATPPDPTSTPQPSTPTPQPPTPTPDPPIPTVSFGGGDFAAEVVSTPEERRLGLSGRDHLEPKTGMLFVFQSGVASTFWMKDMRFPLDFIWISSECTVADITPNVLHPAPNTATNTLATYSSSAAAAYTFEINAGEAAKFGISVGDPVRFSDMSTEAGDACP